jgi:hypothetical protein
MRHFFSNVALPFAHQSKMNTVKSRQAGQKTAHEMTTLTRSIPTSLQQKEQQQRTDKHVVVLPLPAL